MTMAHRTDLLTLCVDLHKAGIWLSLNAENVLTVGPSALVKQFPTLLAAARTHKAELLHLLEDCLAHGVFGTEADDPRFERELCPECQQPCLIVLSPRRLGVHRLPDGKAVCPGSDRAQMTAVDAILSAFVADRCVDRQGSVLTWHSLRGALETWCLERTFFLPPRPFVLQWLDTHYTRHGEEDRPGWYGVTLTLREWGLEEPNNEAPRQEMPKRKAKFMVKA